MSCQHGNSIGHCDICDEVDAAWKAGEASGKRSAEHCTCPACRITHTNCCAVHNMPAMPIGHCDCGAIPPPPVRSVSEEDVLTIEQVREGIVGFVKECARRSIREPIQEANCKNLAGTFESWIKAIDHHFAQSHGVAGAVKVPDGFLIGSSYSTLQGEGRIVCTYKLEWIDRSEKSCGVALWRNEQGILHLQNLSNFSRAATQEKQS